MDHEHDRRLESQIVNLGLVGVSGAGLVALRCECGQRGCRARILVSRAEYDRHARGFRRLFVAPGHGSNAGTVTPVNDRFAVVDLEVPQPVLVEVLSVDDCPHVGAAELLVEAIACRLDIDVSLRRTVVATPNAASRLRFLGSPTVRVEGVDVEPGAAARCDYALGCRLYRTASGPAPLPAVEWIGAALTAATSGWPAQRAAGLAR